MASIREEVAIGAPASAVWGAARDVGALHVRLVPGFVIDTRLEGNVRVVTFASGAVARERIVTVDDTARRLVWAIEGDRFSHHNGALQVLEDGGQARVVWTTDLLPDELAAPIREAMVRGLATMKKTLEAQTP